MKTILNKIALIGFLIMRVREGDSQGFVNLDFESADLTGYSRSDRVPATNAFPGWTVSNALIFYDDISLGGQSISIMDANSIFQPPPQGSYYALFTAANTPGSSEVISLGQTGTIPVGTRSITFWGNIEDMQVSFEGQPLTFFEIGSTANYNIYSADITAFAGDTGQLLFSVPPSNGGALLDNIQFSPSAVPEPSEFALAVLGATAFAFRRWQKSPRIIRA